MAVTIPENGSTLVVTSSRLSTPGDSLSGVTRPPLDPARGAEVAKDLKDLGVKGILITAAEAGYITELRCGMDECHCPEQWGGRGYFESGTGEYSDWDPTHEHFPRAKRDGGHRTLENSVLAHRICNRMDYSIFANRSHKRDLERIRKAHEAAAEGKAPRPPS